LKNFGHQARPRGKSGDTAIMNTMKKYIPFLFVFFLSFFVSLLSPLSPFSNVIARGDSGVYLTIAQGMLDGKTPYLDFFDHKGPLLYLINYAGLLLGGSSGVGVWFMELLAVFVTLGFAYKTARFFAGEYLSLLGVTGAAFSIGSLFSQGNMPEEYAMPFISISLFLYAGGLFGRFALNSQRIFAFGACFGATLLLKPNLFSLWAVFSAILLIHYLLQKWKDEFVRYVIFFPLGTLTVLAPFVVYLSVKHALGSCVDEYLFFNNSYASNGIGFDSFSENIFTTLNRSCIWITLLVGGMWLFRRHENKEKLFYYGYFFSVILSILAISFSQNKFGQYCLVLTPFLAPACACFLQAAFADDKKSFLKYYFAPLATLLLVFNVQFLHSFGAIYNRINPGAGNLNNTTRQQMNALCAIIKEHRGETGTITVVGNSCQIYFFAKAPLASKYIYQWPVADIRKEIADEYFQDIVKNKPKLIIFPKFPKEEGDKFYSRISGVISLAESDDYFRLYEDKGFFTVFKRKDN
jgi:hypothetical protein